MASSVSFNLDISKFRDQLVALRGAVDAGTHKAVDRGGAVIKASIQSAAPVGRSDPGYTDPKHPQYSIPAHTGGQLRRSVTQFASTSTGAGLWEVSVGPTVVYGRFREFGGMITPKRSFSVSASGSASSSGGLLRWSAGGRAVFARSVNQKGSRYVTRGMKAAKDPVRAVVVATYDEAIKAVTS